MLLRQSMKDMITAPVLTAVLLSLALIAAAVVASRVRDVRGVTTRARPTAAASAGRHHRPQPTQRPARAQRTDVDADVVPLPANYAKRLHPDVPTGQMPAVLTGTAAIARELHAA